jgi:hypothetical protein
LLLFKKEVIIKSLGLDNFSLTVTQGGKHMEEPKNPFDFMYDQISQLLAFIQTNQDKIVNNLPSDLDQRLESLRKKIDQFSRLSNEVVSLSEVSEEELKMRQRGLSKELSPEGKALIDRGNKLKREVQDRQDELKNMLKHVPSSQLSQEAKAEVPEEKKLTDKEFKKNRRNKFKRLGSNSKWKPL